MAASDRPCTEASPPPSAWAAAYLESKQAACPWCACVTPHWRECSHHALLPPQHCASTITATSTHQTAQRSPCSDAETAGSACGQQSGWNHARRPQSCDQQEGLAELSCHCRWGPSEQDNTAAVMEAPTCLHTHTRACIGVGHTRTTHQRSHRLRPEVCGHIAEEARLLLATRVSGAHVVAQALRPCHGRQVGGVTDTIPTLHRGVRGAAHSSTALLRRLHACTVMGMPQRSFTLDCSPDGWSIPKCNAPAAALCCAQWRLLCYGAASAHNAVCDTRSDEGAT
jgi:hypothetical protein